jgi:transcriptional regulator with XRE-family HTH domain
MIVGLKSKEIGKRLARKNVSQNWLARKLEISSGYMSQLMCGVRNPSPKLREKIMNSLSGCNFDDLFTIIDADKNSSQSGYGKCAVDCTGGRQND